MPHLSQLICDPNISEQLKNEALQLSGSLREKKYEEAARLAQSSKQGTIRTLVDSIVELMKPTKAFQK